MEDCATEELTARRFANCRSAASGICCLQWSLGSVWHLLLAMVIGQRLASAACNGHWAASGICCLQWSLGSRPWATVWSCSSAGLPSTLRNRNTTHAFAVVWFASCQQLSLARNAYAFSISTHLAAHISNTHVHSWSVLCGECKLGLAACKLHSRRSQAGTPTPTPRSSSMQNHSLKPHMHVCMPYSAGCLLATQTPMQCR
jgi:hypothetical protein